MTSNVKPAGPVKASVRDTLGVVFGVVGPVIARGVIIRRPKVVRLAERLDLDRRAVQRMQRLRDRYGEGPLLMRIPVRRQAVILSPDHVHRVLAETPDPFTAASTEKRAALSHFQPEGVLVTRGPERADRRRFNESVLDTDNPVHQLADRFVAVVREETEELLTAAAPTGGLGWDDFAPAWFRIARRVVFGDAARDDEELTDLMAQLRADANWVVLRPKRTTRRDELLTRISAHLERAEPGSLAALMADVPRSPQTAPRQQVPQWLFAFDAAGIAAFRALALLVSHPEPAQRARAEMDAAAASGSVGLPFLRACVLESVRLWPTTPAVLRETTTTTAWGGGELPTGCGIVIYVPFFHRDDRRLEFANRFEPQLWLEDRSSRDWPLIPFSGGAAMCPGRNLVLLLTSSLLATLLHGRELGLEPGHRLGPDGPLPGTLNPYGLRFRLLR